MGVPRTAGMPDYEHAGSDKRIPWIFSKKTIVKFYDKSVAPFTSTTDYAGEIKEQGSEITFNTIPSVVVKDYSKGATIDWENLTSPAVTMKIERASYTAWKFDKVDLKQFADKSVMDKCSNDASEQMKIKIDEKYLGDIYADADAKNIGTTAGKRSSGYNLGTTGSGIALTKTNIIDKIMECEAVGNEQNWPESDRWMCLPTWAEFLLNVSDMKDVSMTGEDRSILVKGGRIGKLGKFTLYGSNLYTAVSDGGKSCYNITFGHKSGVCFATQLTEMEYFEKFENTFGKGMKGLQVYDWKVLKPESIGVCYAYKG